MNIINPTVVDVVVEDGVVSLTWFKGSSGGGLDETTDITVVEVEVVAAVELVDASSGRPDDGLSSSIGLDSRPGGGRLLCCW
jgi:hypothetical protein